MVLATHVAEMALLDISGSRGPQVYGVQYPSGEECQWGKMEGGGEGSVEVHVLMKMHTVYCCWERKQCQL